MGLPLALIALLSGLALAALSGDGLNVSPDTVAFYDSATNLADGNGLVLTASYPNLEPTVMGRLDFPLVHWAPLWPALLAGPVALGADAADAARWLLCLLLAANVALFGRLVARLTSDNRAATLTGAVLFALSPAGIPLHADALSEPLFLLLALGGLELLASFIVSERRYLAVSAVVVMALALLTRYAGLPLLGAAFLGLALFGPGSRGRRWPSRWPCPPPRWCRCWHGLRATAPRPTPPPGARARACTCRWARTWRASSARWRPGLPPTGSLPPRGRSWRWWCSG